jgi:hypothetical protein
MNDASLFAFDTETVDGEPLTLQFAAADGATLAWVSRATILRTFLTFLATHGVTDDDNVLWAHNLEFDLGVTFIELPEIWLARNRRFYRSIPVPNAAPVEVALILAGATPHGRICVNGRRWLLRDTMAFFKLGLAAACERLRLPVRKLPRPPYLGDRAPTAEESAEFEAYAVNDAVATRELAKYIVARHDDVGIPLTVSVAQMAAVTFRQQFLPPPRSTQ